MAKSKVLLIQTAFLGDLLLSVPLIKSLRAQLPQSEIFLVCRKGVGSILKEMGLVDRVFEVQKKNKPSYQTAVDALKDIEFDYLLAPHQSVTTALMVRKLKAKKKIGFSKWWNSLIFDERISFNTLLPDALRQLSLLKNHWPDLPQKLMDFQKSEAIAREKGVLAPVPDWASPLVDVSAHTRGVREKWNLPSRFVCLFPGSVWRTKQWTDEGFIEVGQNFQKRGLSILVMGGPGEDALCERVAEKISGAVSLSGNTPGAVSLAGKTSLFETAVILSQAEVVISNDSAGQHLASLVGTKTISVFGPTVLEFGYRPWNTNATVVERKGLSCRPCGKHGHQKCPIGTHECMKSISATEVLENYSL